MPTASPESSANGISQRARAHGFASNREPDAKVDDMGRQPASRWREPACWKVAPRTPSCLESTVLGIVAGGGGAAEAGRRTAKWRARQT